MSKTDWAVVALNAFTLVLAVVGVSDPVAWGHAPLLWAVLALAVSGGWIIRRGSMEQPRPQREGPAVADVALEARQLLEIDERLEMLERRDAQHVRELAYRGEMHGPAAPLPGPSEHQVRQRDRA